MDPKTLDPPTEEEEQDFQESLSPYNQKYGTNHMPTSNPPLSVAEVLQLEDDSWVNDGLIATVVSITKKTSTRTRRDFWVCQLADSTDGRDVVECAIFTAPKFREGERIAITGKGVKFENGQYGPKVNIGKTTDVRGISDNSRREANQEEPRRSAPRDGARGGGQEQGGHEPETGPVNSQFHPKMNATALFYLHCLSYARKINTTLKATGHPDMSPDHFQACVSTLFIAGDRNGLAIAPPPSSKISPPPTEEPKKAHPARREPDPLEDEDVPF